jgi:hypothetical protein
MAEFFSSGEALELIIMLMVIEGCALIVWQRRSAARMDLSGLLLNLMSGICLMGAVHGALTGQWWGWIAVCLLVSMVMHIADLWRRWSEGNIWMSRADHDVGLSAVKSRHAGEQ